jgi:hypothetical protein
MPTGQASSATRLRAPLAIAPRDKPKNEIAAISRRGAPQQIAMPSVPLSHPFPCIGPAADPCSVFTRASLEFSTGIFSCSKTVRSDIKSPYRFRSISVVAFSILFPHLRSDKLRYNRKFLPHNFSSHSYRSIMSFILSRMFLSIIPPPRPIIPPPRIIPAIAALISILMPWTSSPTSPIMPRGRSRVAIDMT